MESKPGNCGPPGKIDPSLVEALEARAWFRDRFRRSIGLARLLRTRADGRVAAMAGQLMLADACDHRLGFRFWNRRAHDLLRDNDNT